MQFAENVSAEKFAEWIQFANRDLANRASANCYSPK